MSCTLDVWLWISRFCSTEYDPPVGTMYFFNNLPSGRSNRAIQFQGSMFFFQHILLKAPTTNRLRPWYTKLLVTSIPLLSVVVEQDSLWGTGRLVLMTDVEDIITFYQSNRTSGPSSKDISDFWGDELLCKADARTAIKREIIPSFVPPYQSSG